MTDQRIDTPPHNGSDLHQVQRTALRDLVALATECAATESRIEQEYQSTLEEETKQAEKARKEIAWNYDEQVENASLEYQQRVRRLDEDYQARLKVLKAEHQAARNRVQREHAPHEEQIKKDYQQEVWLADSVFELTQNQAHDDARKARSQLDVELQTLGEIERDGKLLVALYGQSWPASTEPETDGIAAMPQELEAVQQRLRGLRGLVSPRLLVGATPYLIVVLVLGLVVTAVQLWARTTEPQWEPLGIALAAAVAVLIAGGVGLWFMARSRVREAAAALSLAIARARIAAEQDGRAVAVRLQQTLEQAQQRRQQEIQVARDRFTPMLQQVVQKRDSALHDVDADYGQRLDDLQQQRDTARAQTEQWKTRTLEDLRQKRDQDLAATSEAHEQRMRRGREQYENGRSALEQRLTQGLAQIRPPIDESGNGQVLDWAAAARESWQPPSHFAQSVRIGQMHVDLKRIAESGPQNGPLKLALPDPFDVPVSLSFPSHGSLLVETQDDHREHGIRILQMTMARLLTSLPPGRVRFTIIDPLGLGQNFAGFMHLADHDEALVGGRIWTEAEQIETRLADLTEHMETVIQKYLRNEFETIDDYNAQAGELAEPYRYLVIADFPVAFEGEAMRRLSSIIASGPRCGVYVLIHRDARQPLPAGVHLDQLDARGVHLVGRQGRFDWKDAVFGQFPLRVDDPPDDHLLRQMLETVGRRALEAKRVEVPFEAIAPPAEKLWSGEATQSLTVPIGRTGATRLQTLRLGRGVAQHALVAGKTGSGKSTLLHVLITNLALWYRPEEVEFYLVDFKKGVEFKTYAAHSLPHARAIAVESDREFGLSVLHRVDAELSRRGELFRKAGVQDLPGYRKWASDEETETKRRRDVETRCETGPPAPSLRLSVSPSLPRVLLIVDEFQEFFSEDDKLAQDAALLLDRLVRQGRAFGIHVLLGSQTIGGTSGLSRSTLGQIAVRIALQTSEADSQLILGESNAAARLLSRPGEAIYNDQGGLVEANSPFQVAWLPDGQREDYLRRVSTAGGQHPPETPRPEPIVFEGNVPSDITKNRELGRLLSSPPPDRAPSAVRMWLGEPVAIKEATAAVLRRQSGSNLVLIGQQEEPALAIVCAAILSAAAQQSPKHAEFFILDGTPPDSPLAGSLARLQPILPHSLHLPQYREAPDAIARLHEELQRRLSGESSADKSIYLIVHGLHRYRVLRKQEEEFSFAASDEPKKPDPGRQFAELLREGPPVGVHVVAWADTPASIDRMLERASLREFDHRVLFQMSATDSSNLIDSPAANRLGLHRAMLYSEEQGTLEKFRPYALPDPQWLEQIRATA